MKKVIWENEYTIVYQEEKLQYLQFKKLLEYPKLKHCYTLRSEEKLNFLSEHVDIKTLENSKKDICKILQLDIDKFIKPHQTHTDKVEKVESANEIFDEVDGLITDKREITLCTTSADCTDLLFYDSVKQVIGDVHSGWRGTVQKIGQKAVNKMIKYYKCNPDDIICCICPHIRKCHFEVEQDVVDIFLNAFSDMKDIQEDIVKTDIINGKQKYHIDTTRINIEMLKQMGLKGENIIDSQICTVCESENFYSYRTDKEQSGRNGAIISLGT